MSDQVHECNKSGQYDIRQDTDGLWYVWDSDGDRGKKPLNFCVFCGERLAITTNTKDTGGE